MIENLIDDANLALGVKLINWSDIFIDDNLSPWAKYVANGAQHPFQVCHVVQGS